MNPCRNCLTLAMCRNRILQEWKKHDFDPEASDTSVFHTLSIMALNNHCSIFESMAKGGKLFNNKRIADIMQTFNINFEVDQ